MRRVIKEKVCGGNKGEKEKEREREREEERHKGRKKRGNVGQNGEKEGGKRMERRR